MYRLFFTPSWFHGWDLLFGGISLLIVLLIATYSWKIYCLSKENKHSYFSLAFSFIALALVFKIITHSLLYYPSFRKVATKALAPLIGENLPRISELFFRAGFFFSMVTMLGALLLIFFISQRKINRLKNYYEISQICLFIYLIVLISIISNFKYVVFYLTSLVILSMIVLNYYKNYLDTHKNNNAFLVMSSFLLLLISQFFFLFVFLWKEFYVLGEIFSLGGFLLLLNTYQRIKHLY